MLLSEVRCWKSGETPLHLLLAKSQSDLSSSVIVNLHGLVWGSDLFLLDPLLSIGTKYTREGKDAELGGLVLVQTVPVTIRLSHSRL